MPLLLELEIRFEVLEKLVKALVFFGLLDLLTAFT